MVTPFLESFVIFILAIKVFVLLSLVKLIYYKIFDSDNKDGIEKTSERKENIDWIFESMVSNVVDSGVWLGFFVSRI